MGSFHLITVVPPLGAQLLGQCLVAHQVGLGCLHTLPNTVITNNTGQQMVVRCYDYHQGHCVSVLLLVMLHYYPLKINMCWLGHILAGCTIKSIQPTQQDWPCTKSETQMQHLSRVGSVMAQSMQIQQKQQACMYYGQIGSTTQA